MGLGHSPAVVSEGLVFYFDPINTRSYAGTGLTGYNLIDTSIVGSFLNGPVYDGANKGSIYFDGVDDYIDFGSSAIFKLLDNFTLSAWVKSSVYGDRAILGNFGPSTDYSGFNLNIQPSNKFAFLTGSAATATYLYSNDTFLLNQWYHLTAVRQNGTNYLYVNGAVQSSTNTQVVKYSNQNFYFGKWYSNLTSYYHNGQIASAALYNKALSSTEILQNYNATKKRFSPEENIITNGLIYNFDAGNSRSYSGTGLTAFDLTGSGITANLVNGTLFSTLNGGAFVFDGVNDYINVSTDVLDIGTSDFSANIWFKTGAAQTQTFASNQVSNGWNGFNFGMSSSGFLTPTVDWGNSQQYGAIQSASAYNDSTWKNATFIMNGSTVSNWKLFINGSQVTAPLESGSVSTISGTGISNAVALTIGTRAFGSYCNGSIAQVQIYNRALSSTEILQNYNAAKSRYGLS